MRRLTSLWNHLWRLWDRVVNRELGLIAAGVAFFGFLAVFPALAAVIALWGFVADPTVIRSELEYLRDLLPPEAYALLSGQVEALLQSNNRQLGWTTLISTLLALWSARAGVDAMIRGLNAIHGLPPRGGVQHLVQAVLLTLVLIALALAAMALSVVVPLALKILALETVTTVALELLNFLVVAVLVVLAVGLIYRLGPNHADDSTVPLFTRGLVLALVLWAAVSRGLVVYLANFASYNKIYGSIGAVVALLLWFYLSAYAVLLGAAMDAERTERRRRKAAAVAERAAGAARSAAGQ